MHNNLKKHPLTHLVDVAITSGGNYGQNVLTLLLSKSNNSNIVSGLFLRLRLGFCVCRLVEYS